MNNAINFTALLLVATAISGCSTSHSAPNHNEPALYIVCIDRSSSTNPMRGAQIDQLQQVITLAATDGTPIEFWTFDHRALCQWGPQSPRTSEALIGIEQKTLKPSNAENRHITRPALLLQAINRDTAFNTAKSADILMLTDGDNEVPTDSPLFTREAASIAAHKSVKVAVLDINPENRPTWQQAFHDLPQSSLLVAGDTQSVKTEDDFLNN